MRILPSVRTAYVLVLATLAVGGLAMRGAMSALDVYLRKEPVALRADFGSIPAALGRWKKVGEDQQMDSAMVESLGTDKYLTRSYAIDGDPAKGMMLLHLAYYTGMIDTVPHIPERCWGAGGLVQLGEPAQMPLAVEMLASTRPDAPVNAASGKPYPMATVVDPVTQASEDVALPIGDFAMTLTTFQDPKAPRFQQLGGYLFIANGRCTPSTIAVRSLAFDLTDRFAYFCKLQLSARYPLGDTPPARLFSEQAEDFLTQLLPHLMRRLPDWPSVERGGPTRG
ncbi:MAG: exosortase-associated EpsI family protein [Planctomycetes bacterium]|nr:exosortase-associated EpsI family protein [Planctomycetota bacterium]